MKIAYLVLAVLIIAVALGACTLLQRTESNSSNTSTVDVAKNNSNATPQINPFNDLRNRALTASPEQFEVDQKTSAPMVYGVVMDWNLGTGTATFVSFISGDASMYTSTGGGVIGGIGHENVRSASIQFVKNAQKFVPKAHRSDDLSLPDSNRVKFFFLTTKGRFVAEEQLTKFDDGSSRWLELFEDANKVITELRTVSGDFGE